jgi:NAD(P)-dependent dehydrogenase (short-subunit alcohol dehydrogenase family)
MRSYANNLAPHSIRVNTVHPTVDAGFTNKK